MRPRTEKSHHDIVHAVLRCVREQPTGRLDELAEIGSMSPFHFHRVFQRLTGRTPHDHTRNLRLVRAAVALRTDSRPIVAIALEADYQNHESFSRAFRREFGSSPAVYRKRHAVPSKVQTMKDLKPAVALVKIPVTDFGRAQKFYRDTLGLEEEFAVEAYGWAQYITGDVPLCLYVVGKGGGDGTPGGETNFHLAVDDAKKAYDLLKSRGAELPCELVKSDDGGTFFMVADPDGNKFKIQQRT